MKHIALYLGLLIGGLGLLTIENNLNMSIVLCLVALVLLILYFRKTDKNPHL